MINCPKNTNLREYFQKTTGIFLGGVASEALIGGDSWYNEGVAELRMRMFCNNHFLLSQNVNVLFAAVFPEPLLADLDLLFVDLLFLYSPS